MLSLKLPHFGEKEFTDHRENSACRTVIINGADSAAFDSYCKFFEANGFCKKEEYTDACHRYTALHNGNDGVFLNYFSNTLELEIVIENDSRYFEFTDSAEDIGISTQITQVHLEDFGLSYAVRLSDGRFIVFDGGWGLEPDADRLFEVLKSGSPHKTPVIAAWIMTHPHCDHFHCFFTFTDKYRGKFSVERFMFNFPDADDLTHYPNLGIQADKIAPPETMMIPRLYEYINTFGAPIYTPHTGQRYCIGGAVLDILSSIDDTVHATSNLNATSLVIRMTLCDQVILWTADAAFSHARLPQRYRECLRADILQVPHHGFGGGTAEAEMLGYDYIHPEVCLLPVNDYNAFSSFDAFKPGARHLMTRVGVKELITGEHTRTLTLPYTASESGERELYENYRAGTDDAGARTWIYTGLNTANKDDFIFTLLNVTSAPANVMIELFFEDPSQNIMLIKCVAAPRRINTVCIIDKNDVDSESEYFNSQSLQSVGIPKAATFAVRFISDIPIVVSHSTHSPAHRSTFNK